VIATAYTWEELLSEPGVGSVTANQIVLWLEERGDSLRPSPASNAACALIADRATKSR
jgi:hypothetical protein